MAKRQYLQVSRAEELEILKAQGEEIRKNPEYGFQLLQKAGIYDANRRLTAPYRNDK